MDLGLAASTIIEKGAVLNSGIRQGFGCCVIKIGMDTKPVSPSAARDDGAKKEKKSAARSSVFAAVLLTGMKIVVGLLTGSLGILAEAAHSGLDLIAAIMTLIAVSVSSRPADSTHPYGHGKIENL
jgi:Co/Zn/Cd efflux system component